jgi:hypothetical protein
MSAMSEVKRTARGRFAPGSSGNPAGPRRAARAAGVLTQLQLDALVARAVDRSAAGSDEVLCGLLIFLGLASLGGGTADSRPEGQAQ